MFLIKLLEETDEIIKNKSSDLEDLSEQVKVL
jgi:hypothetical protein